MDLSTPRSCTKCQEEKTVADFYLRKTSSDGIHTFCKKCVGDSNREYYEANREELRKKNRVNWHSRSEEDLKRQQEKTRAWRAANRSQVLDKQRSERFKLKLAALSQYGPTCMCCGEYDSRLLTIEHSNGDGAAHRREIFGNSRGGSGLYRWLRDNGYPRDLGLAVLCGSCNQSSHQNGGICPHSDPREAYLTTSDPLRIKERIRWLEEQLELESQRLRRSPVAHGA